MTPNKIKILFIHHATGWGDYSGEIGHLYQMKSAIGSGGNKAS